ncbi:Rv2231c family pyridoxal phosphate-dependent protein CobC [Corynebacterium gerontici]|uniref:Aminotransferase n=1 Tax=Corynebacterium gerontici TaxID=2079234 RepID=A0A3G6J1T7_9CORY|nr:Rv2231c family pyridoxal phosphate-dependent protein CobC [Corynebacterium gerontici]AZA11846.1 Threonine-phosphate decarboxylase [Corynebacterium gerontici]
MFDPRIHGDLDAKGARLDFAVNVADETPRWLQKAIVQAVGRLRDYPDAEEVSQVEAQIAEYHGVPSEQIMLTSGASEAFALLKNLAPVRPCIIHPGFSEPDAIFGSQAIHHVLHPPFEDLGSLPDCDMAILGNPTNPTGVLHDPRSLRAPGRTVVVDEAFLDVVGEEHSLIPSQLFDVLCLRSLTKTWAIAGLRVGYVAGPAALLDQLRATRAHWPVNTLALAAAAAVFEHGVQTLPAIREAQEQQRGEMLGLLEAAGFAQASRSVAPFVLMRTPFEQPERIRQELLRRGIAVRRCDTFPGLDLNHWRLALRPQREVREFLNTLHQIGVL